MSESDKTNEDVKDTVEEKTMTDDTADTVEDAKKTKVKKRSTKKKTDSEQKAKGDQREVLTKKLEEMGVMSGKDVSQTQGSEATDKRLSRIIKIGGLAAAVMIGGIVYTELTKDSDSGSRQAATSPVLQNPAMMPPGMYMDPRVSPYAQTPVQSVDRQPTDEEKEHESAQDDTSATHAYVDPWGRPYPQRPPRPYRGYQSEQDHEGSARFEGRYGGTMSARRWGPQPNPMWIPPQWRQPPHMQQPGETAANQPKQGDEAADSSMTEKPEYPQQYRPFPPPGYYTPYYGYWYPPAY